MKQLQPKLQDKSDPSAGFPGLFLSLEADFWAPETLRPQRDQPFAVLIEIHQRKGSQQPFMVLFESAIARLGISEDPLLVWLAKVI